LLTAAPHSPDKIVELQAGVRTLMITDLACGSRCRWSFRVEFDMDVNAFEDYVDVATALR